LVAYTAIGCQKLAAAPLHPQRPRSTWLAFNAAPALPPRRFDIPAGLLRDAAQLFRKLTNLEITMTNEGIGQLTTAGVSGVMTPEQALDQMLKNTGIHWRFAGTNSVLLEVNSVTESIAVSASISALPGSVSKYSEPIRDTPQTEHRWPAGHGGAEHTTLRDALRNVAGISSAAGEGGAQGDNPPFAVSAHATTSISMACVISAATTDPFNLKRSMSFRTIRIHLRARFHRWRRQ
jgi:catecholate siderophore receptor